MMPLDVYKDLTVFAKGSAGTGLGKFDYSVAIRILLDKAKIYEKILDLEADIMSLEVRMSQVNAPKKEVKTDTGFGGIKLGEKK